MAATGDGARRLGPGPSRQSLTDVWGRYVKRRDGADGETTVITAPFKDERGKAFLDAESLRKHFRVRSGVGVLGVHSASADQTSRWLGIDIDLHDDDDLSVSAEGNFAAAVGWSQKLIEMGFDPLLVDSNGKGGFHILVVFEHPMATRSVHEFGKRLLADFQQRGLDKAPEVFPGSPHWDHYGDWLRLPGRHHTREHYSRIWNDEPFADEVWLEGNDAIDRLLATRLASSELAQRHGIETVRRTICIDFDGTPHSYRSGWCGAEVILTRRSTVSGGKAASCSSVIGGFCDIPMVSPIFCFRAKTSFLAPGA